MPYLNHIELNVQLNMNNITESQSSDQKKGEHIHNK